MSNEPSPGKRSSNAEDRLPFEPRQKRQKKTTKSKGSPTASTTATVKNNASPTSAESMRIPDVVSKRMVRRMALLCGVPSFLGIATFFVSYFLIKNVGLDLPNPAVVLVSMGFLGIGVLGLSYGVLSASWDEDAPGTILGWSEFSTNLGRMTSAWRQAKQKD